MNNPDANIKYFPTISKVKISTANPKLDGSGSIATLVTANNDGCLIGSFFIKAEAATTQGMIRLFIHDGTSFFLYREIPVHAQLNSSVVPAFEARIYVRFYLKKGYSIGVSTEKAETFNVLAESDSFENCNCI